MSTQTTIRLATLPQVNLLPPEIEQQRQFRRVQIGLGGAVLASLVVVAALFVLATGQVSQAQQDLDANKAQGTQLDAKVAEFAEVPLIFGQVEASHAQLGQAMGQEVRWSYFLNDLSLKIPRHVWLDSMTVTSTPAGAAAAVPAEGQFAALGIGTVQFNGHAFSHNDVAAWLNSLAKQKGYTQPYFSDSTIDPLGTNEHAVSFTSQVTVTDDALSKRYTEKAGN
jgi:Tfp pilus assembly protein PilN